MSVGLRGVDPAGHHLLPGDVPVRLPRQVLPHVQTLNLMPLQGTGSKFTPPKRHSLIPESLTTKARMMFFLFSRTLFLARVELLLLGAWGTAQRQGRARGGKDEQGGEGLVKMAPGNKKKEELTLQCW